MVQYTMMKKTDRQEDNSNSASFVDRIAKVLVCLSQGVNTVTDISKYSNLSISTTHRVLNILTGPRFTLYDSINHRYYLGPLITRLSANPKATHQYLLFASLGEMRSLSDISEETVSLDMVTGIEFIHLHDIPSKHGLKVLQDFVESHPIEPLGAAQKVLLSQLKDHEIKMALKAAAIWRSQDPPVAEEHLMVELAQIRRQGYAITCGEGILGAMGISAPVMHYSCPVVLTILGPENRIRSGKAGLIKELLKSAGNLSRNIAEFIEQKPANEETDVLSM